ncbi:arsenic resistance N-acetyltransferase ArsN2 [Arcobacter sp.]|uniref:arsenic resistance N-acetyltransferase ArsN2 n=1 Tax=Arcobacter sp. TaxID=1872629 RepID=UPI003D108386
MKNKIELIPSEIKYLENVKLLLQENELPYEDIDVHFANFILAKNENEIVGAIGLEKYDKVGLLRSFVVDKSLRNEKIGNKLLTTLLNNIVKMKLEKIYLLTTTAEKYFLNNGFQIEDKENLPYEIKQTKEFKGLCPCSAVAMSLGLDNL